LADTENEDSNVSIVDLLLEETKDVGPPPKGYLPKIPQMDPKNFNRHNISSDLGHLFAFSERLEEEAQKIRVEDHGPRGMARIIRPILADVKNVQERLQEYLDMMEFHHVQLRKKDAEIIGFIKDSCTRIEFTLYGKKIKSQAFPNLRAIEDEWVKKILQIQTELLTFRDEVPVFVYEYSDLCEVSRDMPILMGFEHKSSFTAVVQKIWGCLTERTKTQHVKKLVTRVGRRMRKVRVVDQDGKLLAECENRHVTLY
jgi:hypothetical protein